MRGVILISLLTFYSSALVAQLSSSAWKKYEAEADTLFNRQDFEGAIGLYNKVAGISKLKDKEAKGILYKRAICYYSIGQFDRALADINIFIPEYETFPQARLLRAFINRELDDTSAQLTDIDALLELNPLNADLIKWKTGIYLDSDRFKEAKSELLKLQQFTNDEEIETQLGFAFYNVEQPDSAFIHFENALTINPGYLPAYLYISSLCLEERAFELALTYIDLALKLDPKNSNLFLYKGVALIETEKKEEGCRYLSKAFYAGLDEAGDYLKQYCYQGEK
jgi:tetratricopeptide (TPR) repeat protein